MIDAARPVIVTGPPRAGKTTTARLLAERSSPDAAAHLHTDDFYNAIGKGFIDPWKPAPHAQNVAVSDAIAVCAARFARRGYEVIVDGIVGPWFLDIYREALRGCDLRYVVLRPPAADALQRARTINPIAEYPPGIYAAFAAPGAFEAHTLDTSQYGPEETAGRISDALRNAAYVLA